MTFSMSLDGHQWNIPVESYLFTFMSMFSICSLPGISRGSCRLRKTQTNNSEDEFVWIWTSEGQRWQEVRGDRRRRRNHHSTEDHMTYSIRCCSSPLRSVPTSILCHITTTALTPRSSSSVLRPRFCPPHFTAVSQTVSCTNTGSNPRSYTC